MPSYRDSVIAVSADAASRAAAVFDRFVPPESVIEDLSPTDRARLVAALVTIVLVSNARVRTLAATSVAVTLSVRHRTPIRPVRTGPPMAAERARLSAAISTLLDRAELMESVDA